MTVPLPEFQPNRWTQPNDPEMQKLFEMQQEISLVLLNDALRTLGDVCVFLALEEERESEAKEILEGFTDVLYRGGRL